MTAVGYTHSRVNYSLLKCDLHYSDTNYSNLHLTGIYNHEAPELHQRNLMKRGRATESSNRRSKGSVNVMSVSANTLFSPLHYQKSHCYCKQIHSFNLLYLALPMTSIYFCCFSQFEQQNAIKQVSLLLAASFTFRKDYLFVKKT